MNRNLKKTITALILLAVTATNIFLAKNQPDKFFAAYIPFSRKAVNVAGKITSFVPFSLFLQSDIHIERNIPGQSTIAIQNRYCPCSIFQQYS